MVEKLGSFAVSWCGNWEANWEIKVGKTKRWICYNTLGTNHFEAAPRLRLPFRWQLRVDKTY